MAELAAPSRRRAVAAERESFLSDGTPPSRLRAEIALSWQRCAAWSVPPEIIEPPYQPGFPSDSRLVRAATPVLDRLAEQLDGLGVSLLLTDAGARIVDRRVSDHELLGRLDGVRADRGFVFAEDAVGTNGLGSVFESGRTTVVIGSEHYVEALQQFTCAGSPIRDPLSGRIEGVVDVTCAADRTDEVLGVLAEQAAHLIEERLYLQQTVHERALLEQFLMANRRTSHGMVAVSDRLLISNPSAVRLLDGVEHAIVWEHAARALRQDAAVVDTIELPDGRRAWTRMAKVHDAGDVIGALVEIRPLNHEPSRSVAAAPRRLEAPPGLVGSNARWLRAIDEARQVLGRHKPLEVNGEVGAGKLTLARAIHDELTPGQPLVVCDATLGTTLGMSWCLTQLGKQLGPACGTLIIRHGQLLAPPAADALASVIQPALSRGWRCVVTTSVDGHGAEPLLATLGTRRVVLPPLREREDDLPALTAALAAPRQVGREVVQAFMRLDWPGNIRQLKMVLEQMLATSDHHQLTLCDVPPGLLSGATRRRLSRLERAEVHAIMSALCESSGNKKEAAALLGISRSTLYRKLRSVGIDLDNATF